MRKINPEESGKPKKYDQVGGGEQLISIAIVSKTLAVRAGLRALYADSGECTVLGDAARLEDLKPVLRETDVLVLSSEIELDTGFQSHLVDLKPKTALLLLSDDTRRARTLSAMPLRSWGILPLDSTREELLAAARALSHGLVVVASQRVGQLFKPVERSQIDRDESIGQLTDREREVLQALSQGLSNKQIASYLGISEHTVKFHISSIYEKLGASSRTEAVRIGIQHGLLVL